MAKIEVRKVGRHYTLNGVDTPPDKFFGIGGFKFVNHVWAWVLGGAHGEEGGIHIDRARRYIEREVLGNGCRRMRAPVELMFWGPPYFDLPSRPNVANTTDLVNLHSGTGSFYRMTDGLKKVIRMYVVLAREFDIVIEVPWLWTIKGEGPDDPRENVGAWNEHFIGNEDDGVGVYLRKLREEGDGEGEHRVDPGGLNLLADAANEYTVHADVWTQAQLQNVARRWHDRDTKGELLLISQSGAANRYDPPLASLQGSNGYDGVCLHPPRSGEWTTSGSVSRSKWPNELIDFNESMLGWTQADADYWIPLIPKWASLATTDLDAWASMHQHNVDKDIYTTFHTKRAMDAFWPESAQSSVEEAIRSVTGGVSPTPPPPPPPPETMLTIRRNDHLELVVERDPEIVKGGSEDFVLKETFRTAVPNRSLKRLHVFHGLDRGDVVEMDTEIHADGQTLYVRSEHKEGTAPYDAWETVDFLERVSHIEITVVCRVNGENPFRPSGHRLEGRPHWGIRFVWGKATDNLGVDVEPEGRDSEEYVTLERAPGISAELTAELQESVWAGQRDIVYVSTHCPSALKPNPGALFPFTHAEMMDLAITGAALDSEGAGFLSRLATVNSRFPGRSEVLKARLAEFRVRLTAHLETARSLRNGLKDQPGYGVDWNSIKGWCASQEE